MSSDLKLPSMRPQSPVHTERQLLPAQVQQAGAEGVPVPFTCTALQVRWLHRPDVLHAVVMDAVMPWDSRLSRCIMHDCQLSVLRSIWIPLAC